MKIEEIKTIVELMSKNGLTEFKIEAEEMKLCLKREKAEVQVQSIQAMPQMMAPQMPVAAETTAPVAESAEVDLSNQKTVDSPIVGTFYKSSSPESESFVKVGDTVSEDSVVCIIEAMKVMNEIKAETSGVIKEILVDNAEAVEFGQPLFVIG